MKSVEKAWWRPFVQYAGWSAELATNWLEEDGTPKIGHFQWFAMFLWCEKAKEGTWKKCMAWCQNELNAQLARRLLPEKEKGWIGAAWLGYVAN